MMQLIIIGVTKRPVVVDKSLHCHWPAAFISVLLEIPPVTPSITPDPHVSVKRDFERCIGRQLVESTLR